jgi:SAM-dependent methyltransferase
LGATFEACDFGSGEEFAKVEQMVIDDKGFTPDISAELLERHAVKERSRYVDEFGENFAKKQAAFLGLGLEQLEAGAYLPAIEQAVRVSETGAPGQPVYLVDLMAGGSYERVTALLEKFNSLHILGIDRDPSKQPPRLRFEWVSVEIGSRGSDGEMGLGLDIEASLKDKFPSSDGKPHVIVAKKALHELDYELQPALINECARVLRPGGRFILFADTPGSGDGAVDLEKLKAVHDELESLRETLADGSTVMRGGPEPAATRTQPAAVATLLAERDFDATPIGQIKFANTWIMVKDWANQNRHERDHRYFASVPEILEWARPAFGPPVSVERNKYRLNPLIFNEQGLERVLKRLNAEVREGHDKRRAVLDNRAQLLEWISEGEAFRVLVDFTRTKLRKDSPLAVALNANPEEVAFDRIDPALAPLNSGEKAPVFDLPCAVLVFEKH